SLDADEATLLQLARALQGLTLDEARHAIRRALSSRKVLDQESVPVLLEEKRLLVTRTGMIEYIPAETSIEHVGGLEIMKKWLMERRKLFLMRDSISAEIVPKGVLVMGVSGCGKSLSVKAVASCFELPLYRIDMIEIFSGRHGKPEGAFVQACRMLEDMAPAVVWFDEIEPCVVSAMTAAQLEDRDVNDDDLLNVAATIVPLSKTMKEQVDLIRAWAYDRAVRASPRELAR